MTSLVAQAVKMQAGALSQSIGIAVARQQIDAQKGAATLLADAAASAAPPTPAGQGRVVDRTV